MEITEFTWPVQQALAAMHIEKLSEVQQYIPAFQSGKDFLIQSPTGSGKTLAYMLPIVERLMPQGKGKHFPQALILVPTRELALQTADTARKLLSTQEGIRTAVLTGGVDIQVQIKAFSKGADIVIATPARLLDHIRRHTFKPKQCTMLVLDEADVMLSMGFEEDVRKCITCLPEHQTLLCSATYTPKIELLSKNIQTEPEKIVIKHSEMLMQRTAFSFIYTPEKKKLDVLLKSLKSSYKQCLIFANTKASVAFLAKFLQNNGICAGALHSEVEGAERRKILRAFQTGKLKVLTATDVAERGIDIPCIDLLINYDLPDSDTTLLHRCGRTSRANTQGRCEIYITPQEKERVPSIRKMLKETH